MAHACFRSDNMEGTIDGKFLVSLYVDTVGGIDNGRVVKVGNLKTGEREVRSYSAPAKDDALKDLAIIGSEEVVKRVKYNSLDQFTNEEGSVARGYKLVSGDLFAVTAEALDYADGYTFVPGTTICELQAASTKMKAASSATASTTTVGLLQAVEADGLVTWYVFQVL